MNKAASAATAADPSSENPGQRPEHTIRYGRVEVAIWQRQSEDRTWYSFSLSRSYKDKDEQWQRTSKLDEDDLLPTAKALEEAYAWANAKRQRDRKAA